MPSQVANKNRARVVPALAARANFGKLLDGMEKPNGSIVISRRGRPKAILLSIGDYLKLASPEPEVQRLIGEESKKNGTNNMTEADIDAVIGEYRAEKRAGKVRRTGQKPPR